MKKLILLLCLSFSLPTLAHHSVPVNFDTSDTITVTGTITQTKWINPHSQIIIEITGEDGSKTPWLVEMNALNTIRRLSRQLDMHPEDFVIGEELTVIGWRGRNQNAVYFRKAILENGKEIIWESRLDPDLIRVETFD